MSVEAFIWFYDNGEPAEFDLSKVFEAFGPAAVLWELEYNCLHLDYGSPADSCVMYCGKVAVEKGTVRSLTISRPIQHPSLWNSVLRLLSEGNCLLFFSDDTKPRVWSLESLRHFPDDIIAFLGEPVCVRTPDDILTGYVG